LMSIPTSPGDRQLPYRVYHKSLIDFLKDDQRCPGSIRAHEGDDNHPEQFLAKSWVALLRCKWPRTLISVLTQTLYSQGTSHWDRPFRAESFYRNPCTTVECGKCFRGLFEGSCILGRRRASCL
jgi:hypothetical protein